MSQLPRLVRPSKYKIKKELEGSNRCNNMSGYLIYERRFVIFDDIVSRIAVWKGT